LRKRYPTPYSSSRLVYDVIYEAVAVEPMTEGMASFDGPSAAVPARSARVLESIRHQILTGQLRPGQPLVEAELAAQLGVSKTPVREALRTLVGSGLVTMSRYRGAAVRVVDESLARSIYEVRLLLEPEAVRQAVTRRAAMDSARKALVRADAATDRAERSLANRDFHRALYSPCGNELLTRILDDLRDQTALVSVVAWNVRPTWRQEAAEHRAILTAAETGDADGAAELVTAHIRSFVARAFGEEDPIA
jgi:DNA-binding GntR family transcriptional regulator